MHSIWKYDHIDSWQYLSLNQHNIIRCFLLSEHDIDPKFWSIPLFSFHYKFIPLIFFNCQLISLICFGFKLILWLTWINDTRQKSRWEKGKILKVCHFKRLGYWRWNTLFCNVKQNKHLVQWNPADDLNCAMRNKDEMELSGELHWLFFFTQPTSMFNVKMC